MRALRFMRMHEMSVATSGQFKRVPELIRHIPNRQVLLYEKCPTIQNVQDTSAFEKSSVESGLPDNRNLSVFLVLLFAWIVL